MGLLQELLAKALALRSTIRMWRLYDEAKKALGEDLTKIAPDMLGCAESVSRIIQRAVPDLNFPTLTSTTQLYNHFEKSPSFKQVDTPVYADIILAPTGFGNGKVSNGHVGIVGKFTAYDGTPWVMSNTSDSGFWEANMTVGSFTRYYQGRGGYPILFYRLV